MLAVIDKNECTGCGACVDEKECPTNSLSMGTEYSVVDKTTCTGCGACVDVCPTAAISIHKAT
ncbi:DUF362 domain-containing protein [Methanolapillus millepedarum]|uniref:4Fe-4S ferredoxin FdxA n=1 Tax=Methanolapillus millepedarum TaxID=3028296 RepID=A0AA96V6I4_9EURY|nr:4Fe-4S ferredoxin FdxA [Methanosarcinaceae archaeon Ac7]